jgi:hypothetical protein
MRIETEDLITPVHAADQRGVSRQAMNNLIRRGKLPVVWIDGVPFLQKRDVDSYEPEPAGRPSKIKQEKKSIKKISRKNSAL